MDSHQPGRMQAQGMSKRQLPRPRHRGAWLAVAAVIR